MPIPDYQSLMLPMLKFMKDQKTHTIKEIIEHLSKTFNITDEEKSKLLPSGKQLIFDNRVHWAKTYLKKAGLLDSPARASFIITKQGLKVLNDDPKEINVNFLNQFPEFLNFRSIKSEKTSDNDNHVEERSNTPLEILEESYQKIRTSLAQELISQIISQTPAFFEKLVVELLVRMGYGGSITDAGKAIGKTNDEGIDGIIKEDKLGLDIIYIQAKRWQPGNLIGRPEIQKFVGALAGQGAKKGVFITTSSFTKDALEYQTRNDTKVVLIDGELLASLMIDYNVGVSSENLYEIKKIDHDYFGDE